MSKTLSLFGDDETEPVVETLKGRAQGLPFGADDYARCLRCDGLLMKARMHERADGTFVCKGCQKALNAKPASNDSGDAGGLF